MSEDIVDVCASSLLTSRPLVSVHMLAYRHSRFLAQAIEGVLAQRCTFPFELIIAEDCSPDNTLEIALAYQRHYPTIIRVIYGKKNVGMHANSHRGFLRCRGKYIAYCEGDDYWHDNSKLADQIRIFEADKSIVLCHSDFDRLTRFRRRRNVHYHAKGNALVARGDAYQCLLQTWSVMTATSIYRRDVVAAFYNSPFSRKDWPFGDYNMLLFASLRGTVGYLDRSTATFRKVRGSAGNSGVEAMLHLRVTNGECAQMFMNYFPVPIDVARRVTAAHKRRIYAFAFFSGRADLMTQCFRWLKENSQSPSLLIYYYRLAAIKLVVPHWLVLRFRLLIANYLSSISA